MPTVLRVDGYRFFFFSDEHLPVHIHIEKGDGYMRVELDTLNITDKYKFSAKEVKNIMDIIKQNQILLTKAWDEYFN